MDGISDKKDLKFVSSYLQCSIHPIPPSSIQASLITLSHSAADTLPNCSSLGCVALLGSLSPVFVSTRFPTYMRSSLKSIEILIRIRIRSGFFFLFPARSTAQQKKRRAPQLQPPHSQTDKTRTSITSVHTHHSLAHRRTASSHRTAPHCTLPAIPPHCGLLYCEGGK